MILFNTFNILLNFLYSKKEQKIIDKFRINIDQRNEINILIVTDIIVSKEDFISDKVIESYFNFEKLSNEELQDDYFYREMFKKEGDEIVDFKNSRRKLNNLLSPDASKMPSLPIVTFYSYKGGMGRSTHLTLTATYLARKHNKKIVIIDCDFEAPGFTNFFLEAPSARNYRDGLVEYFNDKEFETSINLNQYSWEVSKEFSGNGEIRIIPAGNLKPYSEFENYQYFQVPLEAYLEGLSRFDLSSTDYIIKQFESLIDDVKEQFNPDAIFIDSRTGFTDVFGITALQLSSQVVGFFNNSAQTEPGLFQFINSIQEVLKTKKNYNIPLIINAFSDDVMFEEFKQKVENFIAHKDMESDFVLLPYYSFFEYNPTLAKIGTSSENKSWLTKIDKGYDQGYTDVADKILESFYSVQSMKKEDLNEKGNETSTNNDRVTEFIKDNEIHTNNEENFSTLQARILQKLKDNWPNLYADSNEVNYEEEFINGKFFYRDSMKDIFNFNKYILLGNKGTGKSYLFQALKNENIVLELKKQAQKTSLNTKFIHLVDKTSDYFISSKFFESYKKEIDEIGDFYSKFWKVYTWKTITEQIKIKEIINFNPVFSNISILKDDTQNAKNIIEFIQNIDNIIAIEKDLYEIDKQLNSKEIDLIAIYDNLDLMVEPYKWETEIASLINFWSFSSYKRIHSKLFLRSDLFKKIKGINNIQSLQNNTISIEWQKEEIFNYFFNLVKRLAKEDFIKVVEQFDFKILSNDDVSWLKEFKKKFNSDKQSQFEEPVLRKLCWVFFGQYPDIKAHGESYDWLYKNVMNADQTISIRPFIELLKLSIERFINDNNKFQMIEKGVLAYVYYTNREVRTNCVSQHFDDLVGENGNAPLKNIFEYIKGNRDFQFFEFLQRDFHELLNNVKKEYKLYESIKDLENLMEINGIIKIMPVGNNIKYSFAFLYKYYLGLGNRNRKKGRKRLG